MPLPWDFATSSSSTSLFNWGIFLPPSLTLAKPSVRRTSITLSSLIGSLPVHTHPYSLVAELGGLSAVKMTSRPTSFLRYSRASHAKGSSFVSVSLLRKNKIFSLPSYNYDHNIILKQHSNWRVNSFFYCFALLFIQLGINRWA